MGAGGWRDIDHAALDLAQTVPGSPLDVLSSLLGLAGGAEITAGIALGVAVARFRRSPRDALVPLFIAATVLAEALLKMIVPQAPPPHERSRTVELLPLLQVPFAHSFPSGHVARAAFLLRIAHGIPTWVVALGVIAMAASRVYLGEHWLSDTLGGAALGLGVANVARRVA